MKKILLAALFALCAFSGKAQSVNGTPLKDIDVQYIQIVGTSKMFSKKVTIEIDFGQHQKFFSTGKETQIRDAENKRVEFNSMIDALNFMSKHGYKFVQAYAFAVGNQNVYHYLMEKEK